MLLIWNWVSNNKKSSVSHKTVFLFELFQNARAADFWLSMPPYLQNNFIWMSHGDITNSLGEEWKKWLDNWSLIPHPI